MPERPLHRKNRSLIDVRLERITPDYTASWLGFRINVAGYARVNAPHTSIIDVPIEVVVTGADANAIHDIIDRAVLAHLERVRVALTPPEEEGPPNLAP